MKSDLVAALCDNAQLISTLTGVVSAIAAVVGLGFIGYQIKQGRRTSDLLTLQAFLKDTKEHENSLSTADSNGKDQAFIEFLNFLEVYAEALNSGLIPKVSRKLVKQKLRDSLAVIQGASEWHAKLEKAITGPETFEAIAKFIRKNRREILALKDAQERILSDGSADR